MRKFTLSLVMLLAFATVAKAAPITYQAFLTGPAEFPPNASPATGFVTVTIDPVADTLQITTTFTGLLGITTAAHIHCCTAVPFAGAAPVVVTPGTLPAFPIGVTSGAYNVILDTSLSSTYSAAFIAANGGTTAGAEAALIAALDGGMAYFNIHSQAFPGGEIRGFPVRVPEPATFGLLVIGLGAAALQRRRQRR